jgi:hypothetical protein
VTHCLHCGVGGSVLTRHQSHDMETNGQRNPWSSVRANALLEISYLTSNCSTPPLTARIDSRRHKYNFRKYKAENKEFNILVWVSRSLSKMHERIGFERKVQITAHLLQTFKRFYTHNPFIIRAWSLSTPYVILTRSKHS